MQDLFSKLLSEGESGIKQLVAARTVETVILDFKAKKTSAHGRFEREDRGILGELLSGFANSQGGLAVWGVVARKGPDGIDCAQSLISIAEIERFRSEAETLCGQLLIPRHDGVTLDIINSQDCPGAGYLLVNVERSERRPHRCEAKGDKQYYKRAGDSFFAMEHYDIEDAFQRASTPSLDLVVRPNVALPERNGTDETIRVHCTVHLMNSGDITCRFPYVTISKDRTVSVQPKGGLPQAPGVPELQTFAGGADNVIHPGQTLLVAELVSVLVPGFHYQNPLSIKAQIYYGGMGTRRKVYNFHLSGDDMTDFLRSKHAI
jgi:hypothetical protein